MIPSSYSSHHDLVNGYMVSVSQTIIDLLRLWQSQSHPRHLQCIIVTRRVPLADMFTLLEHHSLLSFFSALPVVQSLVFCLVFGGSLLVFLSLHCTLVAAFHDSDNLLYVQIRTLDQKDRQLLLEYQTSTQSEAYILKISGI